MFKGLFVKFVILLLSVSMISLSSALFLRGLIIKDFREYHEGEIEDRVYRIMASIEGSYEKYSGWNEEDLKENTIWALMLGYELKITDMNGRELMDTDKALGSLSPLMKRRIQAISGLPIERRSPIKELTAYPLFLGGRQIGLLGMRFIGLKDDLGKEAIFIKRSNRFLIISLFGLGGLSIILGLIFSRKLTNPIKELTDSARAISEGNIKRRVSISNTDEIGELAKAFNIMAGNLELQESLRKRLRSDIAHELRTPLSAMQGELEGMIDGMIKVDRERLLSLYEETGRLKKIIEGIEELSRAEASGLELRKEKIELRSFLNNIKERFDKLFLDKGINFGLYCDEGLTLSADPDKVSQIVINLVSNALKATPTGGRVTIWARKVQSKPDLIEISIEDTGSGIKEEDLPFVFERFYKASEGGLGLGLSIARELAHAHGGRIEVRSEYGKGSNFTLYIPTK